jgi:hypothetical protein
MRMRHALWAFSLALVSLQPLIAAPALARQLSLNTRIDDDDSLLTAADVLIKFSRHGGYHEDDGIITERRDQTVSVKAPGSGPLRVRASESGGVRVQPSADGTWSAIVCSAAGAESSDDANAILAKLKVVNANGELTVTGPDSNDWAAYIILSVPRDVALEMSASNGSLSLRDVSGKFTLTTSNGPMSLDGASGDITGEASNGPIQFRGHAGDIHLSASNGPVSVKLDAPTWTGAGLEAHSTNGPVSFVAPEGLKVGVLVEGSEHSPFSFKWSGGSNSSVVEEWGRTHTVKLGTGPVLVRLSTVNGPVQIKAPKAATSGSREI